MIVGFVLTAWSVASTLTHEARGDAVHCTFGWVIEGMKSEIIEVVATQICIPILGEDEPILRSHFSNGLVQPPTSNYMGIIIRKY